MTTAAPQMPKKKQAVCEYISTRIDREVIPLARAAAALTGDVSTQEFISEAVNEVASRILNRPKLARKPPPDPPVSTGRPRKPRPG